MTTKSKPIGRRGSWFATYRGRSFPCVHAHWRRGDQYHDPHEITDHREWAVFVRAIRTGRKVIETVDAVPDDVVFGTWERKGYVALWEVDDIRVEPNPAIPDRAHLRCRYVRLIARFAGPGRAPRGGGAPRARARSTSRAGRPRRRGG